MSVRASWEAALQDALSKQMPWDVTLDDLARVLPSDVWLTALSVQTPTPANVARSDTPAPLDDDHYDHDDDHDRDHAGRRSRSEPDGADDVGFCKLE